MCIESGVKCPKCLKQVSGKTGNREDELCMTCKELNGGSDDDDDDENEGGGNITMKGSALEIFEEVGNFLPLPNIKGNRDFLFGVSTTATTTSDDTNNSYNGNESSHS